MYDMHPYLQEIERVIAEGPYQASGESLLLADAPEVGGILLLLHRKGDRYLPSLRRPFQADERRMDMVRLSRRRAFTVCPPSATNGIPATCI